MQYRLPITLLILLTAVKFQFGQTEARISAHDLEIHIKYLASDELEGRKPGTRGDTLAMEYIRENFKRFGYTNPKQNSFIQVFPGIAEAKKGNANSITFGEYQAVAEEDFLPLAFSGNISHTAEYVFAGYGMNASNDSIKWSDYEDIDVSGKWVVVLRGNPFSPENIFARSETERSKVLLAKDKGAAGVLFAPTSIIDKEAELIPISQQKRHAIIDIPVFSISKAFADTLLAFSGKTLARIEAEMKRSNKSLSFASKEKISATANVDRIIFSTFNVYAVYEGKHPELSKEYIVIGAHYDHLGMGGSSTNSRMPDTLAIHNGADDNASGVACVLELAELFASGKLVSDRSIVFIAFGAEESGLIGSNYFVNNCIIDTSSIVAMLNMDMIGRLNPESKRLGIGGTGTAKETEDILSKLSVDRVFHAAFDKTGYGPSDHAPFYAAYKPVFFFTTGGHPEYHTPFDTAEKIDYEATKEICTFIAELTAELGNMPQKLSFQLSGPTQPKSQRAGLKVTLGIVPDHTQTNVKGLLVGGVREGGPAFGGGVQKGDIIIEMNNNPISDIYEYMYRLAQLKAGETLEIKVVRDNETMSLNIQL